MDKIGGIVEEFLKKEGLWHAVKQQESLFLWPAAVGEKAAQKSRAVSISKGLLKVEVSDSVWLHYLSINKKKLMKKINEKSGNQYVKDIYFYLSSQTLSKDPE